MQAVRDLNFATLIWQEEFLHGCVIHSRELPPDPSSDGVRERFIERWWESSDELERRQQLAALLSPYAKGQG